MCTFACLTHGLICKMLTINIFYSETNALHLCAKSHISFFIRQYKRIDNTFNCNLETKSSVFSMFIFTINCIDSQNSTLQSIILILSKAVADSEAKSINSTMIRISQNFTYYNGMKHICKNTMVRVKSIHCNKLQKSKINNEMYKTYLQGIMIIKDFL